jgi:hypothetical protein
MDHHQAPPISGSWSLGVARAVDGASLLHGPLRVDRNAETEKIERVDGSCLDATSRHREDVEEEAKEDRWCSPDLSWLQSEEEDEEESRYLNDILSEKRGTEEGQTPALPSRGHVAEEKPPSPEEGKAKKRRKLRKKRVRRREEAWEIARRDAWLRELLSSSSENEAEDKYSRFKESGR